MKNRYDQILNDKLGGMESMPPAGLWSQIQNNLPADKATSAFDQMVSQKIGNTSLTPPAGLWNKIAGNLNPSLIPLYKTSLFRRVAAALIIVGAAAGLFFANLDSELKQSNKPSVKNNTFHQNANQPLLENKSEISTDNNSNQQIRITKKTQANEVVNQNDLKVPKQKLNQYSNKYNQENTPKPQLINSNEEQLDLAHSQQSISYPIQDKVESLPAIFDINEQNALIAPIENKIKSENNEQVILEVKSDLKVTNKQNENTEAPEIPAEIAQEPNLEQNKIEDPISLPRNPRNLNKFGMSFHYIPSQINTSVNQLSQQDFNLSMAFQNINFVANVGFGFGFSAETAEYEIDYTRYEFIKVQFVTDSLGFVYDPNTQTYNPIPYGHQEKVYDDVKYSYSAEAITRNTWINIPLNFGYIKDFKKLALMAGAGINYSMIIARQVSGLYEPDNQSTIKNFYYPVRTRVNTNISYNLTTGVAIKMNERLNLSGEVYGVYFQSPIYQDLSKRAFGFGLRMGITYFFQ